MNAKVVNNKALHICQKFFLVVGLLGTCSYSAYVMYVHVLHSHNSWHFDRVLLGKSASLVAYMDHLSYAMWKRLVLEPAFKPTPHPRSTSEPEQVQRKVEKSPPPSPLLPRALIGKLQIPSLDLSVMVLNGTDEWTLSRAVGRVEGTALPGEPGNLAIAGHRDTFFRALKDISAGDQITLTTVNGTYGYKVSATEIVAPSNTQVLQPSSRPSLTLVTCYPFYFVGHAPKRFVVKADRVEVEPNDAGPVP